MTTSLDLLATLTRRLDEGQAPLAGLDAYYAGLQPLAYLSDDARQALGPGWRSLAVNFPKLVVDSLAERLTVTGFRRGGSEVLDDKLWTAWRASGMELGSAQAHVEALRLGRGFAMVWANKQRGTARVSVESASQVACAYDPGTRTPVAAVKRWADTPDAAGVSGAQYATLAEPDKITRYRTNAPDSAPSSAWTVIETIDNPLGVVPVVPIINPGRLLDVEGVSQMRDVLDLSDAIGKLLADALVTSEFYARPRRWATGLEVDEDEDGNPINPFGSEADRVWQSEDAATKFGQFDPASLAGYGNLTATLTQQLGALSGLPPHYLGLNGDQPASADAIRSAEASLVARAVSKQQAFGAAWADVARLIVAVTDGVDPASVDVDVVWASAETRTPAQAADAAAKLVSAGIIPASQALSDLGYTPSQQETIRRLRRQEGIDGAVAQLGTLVGNS